MADDKHIVRDVQRAESTKVVTGDYVSPNGFGDILSGIAGGFGNLIDAAARGSRASAEKAQQSQANIDLYNLYKGAADELASSNMTEEKFLLFDKQLHKQALSISGGDYGAISKAMELAQYNPSFENVKKLYTRNAANQYTQMDLVNTAGSYAVGVDAPASTKERAGYEYLTRQVSSNSFISSLWKTSPGQQSAMINGDSTPGLADTYVLIKSGFRDVMTQNQGANPGVLFNNYYNNTVTNLVNGGMDFAVASKLVDRALVLEKASIFSEDADTSSSFNRMKLTQDYESKQNQLTQDIAQSRILAKKFKHMIRDPQTNQKKEVYISGADLGVYEKNFPNTMKVLHDNQYFELVPQFFQEDTPTYSSSDLNFFFSEDAGRVMDVNKGQDGKKVLDNVITGQNQALDSVIREKESADPSTLKGKGFSDIRKYNQIYQGLKAGTAQFADTRNVMTLKDNSFKSIAKGTNIESDGEGFWQVDESGNLHYYTPTKWMGDYILLDSTDSSRFMGMGSSGAANMRRYSPEISQWLQNLERVYGMDKKRLYDDFNRSQIKETIGAQSFRANQKSPSNAYYSKVAMDMSDEDVNSVLDAVANAQLDITGVSVGIAGRALSDIGEGVVNAAEAAGKAPIEIPRRIADDLGVTEGFAALTDVGLALSGEPQRRQKQRDMLLQQALERNAGVQPATISYEMPAQVSPYVDTSLDINDGYESFIFEEENLRTKAYKDSQGYTTIGVGRNLDTNPLSKEELQMLGKNSQEEVIRDGVTEEQAIRLFKSDLSKAYKKAEKEFKYFESLPEGAKTTIINMMYQLGSIDKFKLFKKHINNRDWGMAAKALKKSNYYRQTPKRVGKLIKMLTPAPIPKNKPDTLKA